MVATSGCGSAVANSRPRFVGMLPSCDNEQISPRYNMTKGQERDVAIVPTLLLGPPHREVAMQSLRSQRGFRRAEPDQATVKTLRNVEEALEATIVTYINAHWHGRPRECSLRRSPSYGMV